MTIKNWKKTSDRPNFEAWHNKELGILMTLNKQMPFAGKHKEYLVQVRFENSTRPIDNEYTRKEDAQKFISTFQNHNIE
jgi:hypothetical protein